MKPCKLISLLLILSAIVLVAPLQAQDHGAPDSIYLSVPSPSTLSTGAFEVEFWLKCDADSLLAASAGFQWSNENMTLDSAKFFNDNWETHMFLDHDLARTNMLRRFMYVGLSLSSTHALLPAPEARHMATYYFSLSQWQIGDSIVIDTLSWDFGATSLFATTSYQQYVPQFGGALTLTYNPWEHHSWYVATGGDDDTGMGTMESPFRTIQFAINQTSEGDSVIVAPGTYYENIVFGGKNILVGSYYVIVDSDTIPEATIIDGSMLTRGDSAGSVVSIVDGETNARLEGFTIRGGIGTKFTRLAGYYAKGGGVLVQNATALIASNVVENNSLTGADCQGGGIFIESDSSSVMSNIIRNNRMYGTNANYGGGLCVAGSPQSYVYYNRVDDNDAAGIAYIDDAHGMAEYNRISGNGAHGIYLTNEGDHTFRRNTILRNDSAGIYANYARPRIEENVIAGNMQGIVSRASSMDIIGNTIAYNNTTTAGGGLYHFWDNHATFHLVNNIFWGNTADTGSVEITISESDATLNISCCDIAGGPDAIYMTPGAILSWQTTNFDQNPDFCDSFVDDYHISAESPCREDAPENSCGTLIGALGVGCGSPPVGRIWYVSVTGNDSTGDGSSDHPFKTIQYAIDRSSDHDTVQVARGTYYGNGNRDIDFRGRKIVLRSAEGYRSVKIECRPDPYEYPGFHRAFVFHNSEDSQSVVEGFTIEHATATDTLFGFIGGGAVYCGGGSAPTIRKCLFVQNQTSGQGGAIFAEGGIPRVTECIFDHNHANIGGALATIAGGFRVDQCEFKGNTAFQSGAAVFADVAYTVLLENSVFYRNSATGEESVVTIHGGVFPAIYDITYEINGCTFADNIADSVGTCIMVAVAEVSCERSIFAFNSGRAVTCVNGDAEMTCCDVYANLGGDWVDCIEDDGNNKSNFSMDPLFCDRSSGDYHIAESSPCAPENTWCDGLVGALGVKCSGESRIVWYVATSGNDEYGDGSQENPFATIQHAIDMSSSGDSVFVGPGTYQESLNYLGKNITVRSLEGPMGARITNERTVNLVTFENGENSQAVLEGFTLQGGWIAVLCINSGPTIRHNILADQNVTSWAAIALSGTPFLGYTLNGDPAYFASVGESPAVIVNNTIVNCANGGISTFSSIAPTIRNNIIAFTGHYGIHKEGIMEGVAYPILGYNDVFGCPVAYQELPDHGPGSIEADPLFARYYSLGPGSPCIDAGDPNPIYNDPDGSRNDMGAIPATTSVVVVPTDEWINVYCDHPMVNGGRPPRHAILRAYDPDGVLCGVGTLRDDGSFGFIPIYHDDIYTETDEGAVEGDLIRFTINGEPTTTDPLIYWTENGDSFELCQFNTERCLTLELHQGWNLVSWNVAYADAIGAAIDGIKGCVDVVMSFDHGGLTYDPSLAEFSTLLSVDYCHGYWFRMNCDATLEICGQDIIPTDLIEVVSGWNLVSYWPQQTYQLEDGFESILEYLLVATAFDNGALTWVRDMDQYNTLTELKPGLGYWVKTNATMLLAYPGFAPPVIIFSESGSGITDNAPVSRYWVSAYGQDITVDDVAVSPGALFEFYTSDGVLCGRGSYDNNRLNFTPIYGSDDATEASKQYAGCGSSVMVKVDGVRVYPDLNWSDNGVRVRIGNLSTSADGLPSSYSLNQNYPNPFNPTTMIEYALPKAGHVTLTVYNVLGQKVRTLVDGFSPAGTHRVGWDGRNDNGVAVSTGVYLYRIESSEFTQTRKMVLVK